MATHGRLRSRPHNITSCNDIAWFPVVEDLLCRGEVRLQIVGTRSLVSGLNRVGDYLQFEKARVVLLRLSKRLPQLLRNSDTALHHPLESR